MDARSCRSNHADHDVRCPIYGAGKKVSFGPQFKRWCSHGNGAVRPGFAFLSLKTQPGAHRSPLLQRAEFDRPGGVERPPANLPNHPRKNEIMLPVLLIALLAQMSR